MLLVSVLVERLFVLSLTGFDVNFMDDVGQTLLNWASAFGTFEMVGRHVVDKRIVLCQAFLPAIATTFKHSSTYINKARAKLWTKSVET